MKKVVLFFVLGLLSGNIYGQLKFTNPGFEDTPHYNSPPQGWDSCIGTPDCNYSNSSYWWYLPAYQGQTYLGLQSELKLNVIPDYESAGQSLNCNFIPHRLHQFTLSAYNVGKYQPALQVGGIIQFWAGFSKCDLDTMLWQSPVLDTIWHQYTVMFKPNKPYTYITFVPYDIDSAHCYIGIDDLSDITVDGYNFLSTNFSDTTITKDSCITLKASSDDTTVTYQWSSIPSGFIATGSNIIDCPFFNTKYICTATYGCGYERADTVNVNVVSNGIEDVEFGKAYSIYPNPTTNTFHLITNNLHEAKLNIYNTLGEVVYQSTITSPNSEIDLSNVPAGIYFVQVLDGAKVFNGKVVKE